MIQHEVLSRYRLKGRLGKKGQRLQKSRQAWSPEIGKFDFSIAALYCLDLHLVYFLVGSSKPELPISSFQARSGRQNKNNNKTKQKNYPNKPKVKI